MNIWEPDVKSQLELKLYALKEIKMLPTKMRKEYVDCIVFKVTTEFPNGLKDDQGQKELQKFINKARSECVKMLDRKYEALKASKESR